jgi:hypothetical protein
MEKRVSEKTCVVDGRREARTADAIMAEFVDIEAGNLETHDLAACILKRRVVLILCTCTSTVVKESNVHHKQPCTQRPY